MFKTVRKLKRIFNFVSFNIRTTRSFGFTTARNVQVFSAILMLAFVKEGIRYAYIYSTFLFSLYK